MCALMLSVGCRVAAMPGWFLNPTPYSGAYTLHPTPYTPTLKPYTLHLTPYTLHPTPYTLHPTLHPVCKP